MRLEEFRKLGEEQRLEAIYKSVERTRKYFMWTLIGSAVFLILPLFGLLFAIPKFLGALSGYGDLGL